MPGSRSRGGLVLPGFFCGATTLRADPDDTVQVLSNLEMVLRRDLVLERFQFGGKEFDDATALGTNHVIVMLMLVIVFVVSEPIAKADFAGKPGFCEKLQGPIHRGLAYACIFFFHQSIQIFTGKVLLHAQKHIQDQVALGRALEPLPLNVLEKNFLFFSH